MLKVVYSDNASADLEYWKKVNPKISERIHDLLLAIEQTPFIGIGKPEALKYELSGYWSRRINQEHRLIYSCDKDSECIYVLSCKGHYTFKK